MPRKKLTTLFAEKASPPRVGQIEYFDELLPGFGLRISYKGAKSWFLTRRLKGVQRRFTLGRFPNVSLHTAREMARNAMIEISSGADPMARPAQQHWVTDTNDRGTFGSVSDEFLNKHVTPRLRARTLEGYVFALKGRYTANWKDRPVSSVTRRDILNLLEDIETQGKHATARLVLAYIRKFLSWCVSRDLIASNPCSGIRASVVPCPRERVLSLDELRRVWEVAKGLGDANGALVATLILTGQRRGETAGMRWQDLEGLDGRKPVWRIPSTLTKNRRPHTVPLSVEAVKVIKARLSGPRSVFVFSNGVTQLSNFSGIKKIIDAKLAEKGVVPLRPWTIHDIRRSLVTGMNEYGIATPHVIEAIVNHVSGHRSGIAGVYNRATYIEERTRALTEWAGLITSSQHDNVLSWQRAG